MNKQKRLIGFLVIVLELFGVDAVLGAKLPDTDAPVGKDQFRPDAIEIPAAQPSLSGMPCREVRRWPKVMTFTGCDAPADKAAQPAENAKTFLKEHAQALALRPDLADLKAAKVKNGLSRTVTRFQQIFDNLPVLNAFISIHQRSSGRVTTVHTSYISDPLVVGASTPVIAEEAAEAIALEGIRQLSKVSSLELLVKTRTELSWFPVDDRSVTLVWALKTRTGKPRGDFFTLVDANTGDRLLQENQTTFAVGSGMAYVPNPIQTSGILDLNDNGDATSLELEGQRIAVNLPGLDEGTTLLKGEFVDVASYKPATCPRLDKQCPDAASASRSYIYTRDQPEFEQIVVYHAIDSVQRYLRDILGFHDAQGKATIRNFPTLANAHWYTDDNSFYSPFADNGRGALHFGDGGVDDAEDADIIIHEFGHAIQHNQNAGCFPGGNYIPQVNEARAIGEGFSDYLAASFYANKGTPTHHAACVGEWDSTSYSTATPTCLRRVDGTKHYPDGLVGLVHSDGEIWSAALWDIRTELQGPTTDQLVLEHHFNLDCSNGVTMPQAALEMIDTDKLLFAGAHQDILLTKFCDRGILKGSVCVSTVAKPVIVSVQKDSTLVIAAPNQNEGASPELRLKSSSVTGEKVMRIVLAFDLSNIAPDSIESARLVMTVKQNLDGWGTKGRNVIVRPLAAKTASFPEGDGRHLGVSASRRTSGSGKGVTWNCQADNDISNNIKNCSKAWNGGDSNTRTAAPFVHTNDLQAGDEVTFDVSDDVKDGAAAWLVKKGKEDSDGKIAYFAKEGNFAMAPRLEITFK